MGIIEMLFGIGAVFVYAGLIAFLYYGIVALRIYIKKNREHHDPTLK